MIKSQAHISQVLTILVLTFQIRQSSLKMTVKSSLKDKLEDDELDLSMMQLSEVPVRVRHSRSTNILTLLKACYPLSLSGHRTSWSESDDSKPITQSLDQVKLNQEQSELQRP